jgi:hypothetical protein
MRFLRFVHILGRGALVAYVPAQVNGAALRTGAEVDILVEGEVGSDGLAIFRATAKTEEHLWAAIRHPCPNEHTLAHRDVGAKGSLPRGVRQCVSGDSIASVASVCGASCAPREAAGGWWRTWVRRRVAG